MLPSQVFESDFNSFPPKAIRENFYKDRRHLSRTPLWL